MFFKAGPIWFKHFQAFKMFSCDLIKNVIRSIY